MTHTGTGTYQYSFTTSSGAAAGSWESIVSAQVAPSQTLPADDFWTVVSSPAQVIIQSMGSTVVPNISANIRITNEGTADNEYQYEWCVVTDPNQQCGDADNVYLASAAKFIKAGDNFDTVLTAVVPTPGTYYFKALVFFGSQSSGASRQFTATGTGGGGGNGGGGNGGGGGGGGGGGSGSGSGISTTTSSFLRADLNGDGKVDAIDFSILLAFWNTSPPFRNPLVDINKDGKVNSTDFSILLYEWGGT